MTWAFCTSGAAIAKAGAYANSTITASGATLALWSDEAEALIKSVAKNDLAANPKITQMVASSWIGQKIILYDMSGYTSKSEAETMVDILENDIRRGLELLKEDKVLTYLGAT